MTTNTALSYCGEQVRAQDSDRYLWCLSFPAPVREAVFAIVAFASEVARIPSVASEPMIGHIRFAWWYEAVEEIFSGGKVRAHPVAEALKQAVDTHGLPREPFIAYLDARELDYGTVIYEHYEALAEYAVNSNYPLLELGLILLGKHDEAQKVHARHAAYVFGMMGIARSVLHHPGLAEQALPFLLQEEHKGEEPVKDYASYQPHVGRLMILLLARMKPQLKRPENIGEPVRSTRIMLLIGNHFLKKIRVQGTRVNSGGVESGRGWLVFKTLLCITFAKD